VLFRSGRTGMKATSFVQFATNHAPLFQDPEATDQKSVVLGKGVGLGGGGILSKKDHPTESVTSIADQAPPYPN